MKPPEACLSCRVNSCENCVFEKEPLSGPANVINFKLGLTNIPFKVNWNKLDPRYKFVAQDQCGSIYAYSEKPFLKDTSWDINEDNEVDCLMDASFVSQGIISFEN